MNLTTSEAAAALGVSARRVIALIQSGRLPATKHGPVYLILKSDLRCVAHRPPGRPKRKQDG